MTLTSLLIFIVTGIFLGLPTGPSRFFVVGAYIKKGSKAAIRVYLGILCALIIYAALALLASDFLSRNPKVETISYLVGSILLILWGGFLLFKGKKGGDASIELGGGSLVVKGFLTALSSPVTPFIYLTLIQFLKSLSGGGKLWNLLAHLLVLEASSGLIIFSIASLAGKKKLKLNRNWPAAKMVMGLFLVALGAFNLYQMLDFGKDGVHIKKQENLLEEEIEKNR